MTSEKSETDGDPETGKPLDGLDHAIDWLKRGGGYDQLRWSKACALHNAKAALASHDEKLEKISDFRSVVKKFLQSHSYTIKAACLHATLQFQSKNKKANTGKSSVEEFFTHFLSSLESIAQGDPIPGIRKIEIDDWTNTMTYFEILRQIPANNSAAKNITQIQGEWNSVHNQWLEIKRISAAIQ